VVDDDSALPEGRMKTALRWFEWAFIVVVAMALAMKAFH
jgi:hypothetical protein